MQAEQNKDPTERQMTKIAREAAKFTVQMMKADGIGTAEFDFIHLVRHNPGHLAWELVQLHNQRNIRVVTAGPHRATHNQVEK